MDNKLGDSVVRALGVLGKNPDTRNRLIRELKTAETTLGGGNVRDEVTGPIVDALHSQADILRKRLSCGVQIEFLYRSRIARDFVMSTPDEPDHVWEPQTTRLLLHLSRAAANVIIGGAYFGDHAILIAKQIQPHGGVVHAFEPNQENLGLLLRNSRLNALANIKAMGMGLWHEETKLRLVGDDALASSTTLEESDATADAFPACTIDQYVRTQKLEGKIDLIMLDIEGGELRALQGAAQTLAGQKRPNLVFEVHRHYVDWSNGLDQTDIVRYLRSLNYKVFAVRDFHSNVDMRKRRIELIAPEVTHIDGPPHGFNMLAVQDLAELDPNLFRMCQHVSPKLLWHKDPALHHPQDNIAA